MTEFTHWVECTPSRNWLRPEPAKNYGITTMRLFFYVKGPLGAVQWMIGTEWGIASVREHLACFPSTHSKYDQPEGYDLGYHSPKPHYEGQQPMGNHCSVIGGECYYDGSGLNAELLVEGFLAGGTDWLWPKLEEYYRSVFEGAPFPDFSPQYLPYPEEKSRAAIKRATGDTQ